MTTPAVIQDPSDKLQDTIKTLLTCAEELVESHPTQARSLTNIADALLRRDRDRMTEFDFGLRDGTKDRRIGRRVRDEILAQCYGREYIRGYHAGYTSTVGAA